MTTAIRASAVTSRGAAGRSQPPRSAAFPICLLLVAATVPWRPSTLYSGGVDPVVAAKAMISAIALTMAWHVRQRCTAAQPIRQAAIWFLLGYLWIGLFGSWTTGDVVPSLILATRVGILATIVILLARSFPIAELLRAWITALGTVAVVAAVTGIPTLASGRLGGGIPAVHPNELAMLCGYALLGVTWLGLHGRTRPIHGVLFVGLLGAIWLTGSRAALGGAIVAMGVMAVQARRLPRIAMFGAVVSFVAIVYLMTATTLLSSFFFRGGEENVTSLSSRTIAWSAAFDYSDSNWVRWMGAGLAKKEIPVTGQYWQTQVLESSWISALVHAGRAGALLLIVWTLWVVLTVFKLPRPERMMMSALLVYILIRSFLESGLVDSSTVYVTFFIISVTARVPSSVSTARAGPPASRFRSPDAVPTARRLGHA